MRLVRRREFLALPAGTVYSHYNPCIFTGIAIKDNNCGDNDWFLTDLFPAGIGAGTEDMMGILSGAEKGKSFSLDFDSGSRDGCFNEENDLWFAVWEPADVQGLIAALQQTLK